MHVVYVSCQHVRLKYQAFVSMPCFFFKFIGIRVKDENIEDDTKTIVWTENIFSVYGAKHSVLKFIRISACGRGLN